MWCSLCSQTYEKMIKDLYSNQIRLNFCTDDHHLFYIFQWRIAMLPTNRNSYDKKHCYELCMIHWFIFCLWKVKLPFQNVLGFEKKTFKACKSWVVKSDPLTLSNRPADLSLSLWLAPPQPLAPPPTLSPSRFTTSLPPPTSKPERVSMRSHNR